MMAIEIDREFWACRCDEAVFQNLVLSVYDGSMVFHPPIPLAYFQLFDGCLVFKFIFDGLTKKMPTSNFDVGILINRLAKYFRFKAVRPEPEVTLTANTGASRPRTATVTIMSTLFEPASTIAIDDRPEIRLKQTQRQVRNTPGN